MPLRIFGQPKWATLARGDEKDLARLAGSGDRRAVDIAIKALGDQDPGTRQNAATSLGGSSGRYAVEPLIKALGDPVDDVRQAAAKSLARLGEARWGSLIQGNHQDFSRLADSSDPRAIEPLVKALRNGIADAAEPLGRLGGPRAWNRLSQPYEIQNTRLARLPLKRWGMWEIPARLLL